VADADPAVIFGCGCERQHGQFGRRFEQSGLLILAPSGFAYDLSLAEHDYPPWNGPPRRSIVICTHPRSGSTLLGEALYFAGGLGCPLEYFHRGFRPSFETRWRVSGAEAFGQAAHNQRTNPSGTFSVKLFWQDVEALAHELAPEEFSSEATLAADGVSPDVYRAMYRRIAPFIPNPVFVHLKRLDEVRQAVSGMAVLQSRVWRAIDGAKPKAPAQALEYDYDRIAGLVALSRHSHAHWSGFFAANGITPYIVSYEAVDRDYAGTVGALLRHLGCDNPAPEIRMQRQSNTQSEAFALRFLRDNAARSHD
jgi:LPS sulfotransferase NodH